MFEYKNNKLQIILKGGLGNQMFQFIFGLKLGQLLNKDVIFINSFNPINFQLDFLEKKYKFKGLNHSPSKIRNFIFNFKRFINFFLKPYYFLEKSREYVDFNTLKNFIIFDGYWQSFKYFQNYNTQELRDIFFPKILYENHKDFIEILNKKNNNVFVGVRRGDYLKKSHHYGQLTPDYYFRGMLLLKKRLGECEFTIFSNDIIWCKKNLNFPEFNIKFRESNKFLNSHNELFLMSNYNHAIIANSTFHWWAAYLIINPNKLVIAPINWFIDSKKIDIIPKDWIEIKR